MDAGGEVFIESLLREKVFLNYRAFLAGKAKQETIKDFRWHKNKLRCGAKNDGIVFEFESVCFDGEAGKSSVSSELEWNNKLEPGFLKDKATVLGAQSASLEIGFLLLA